MSKSIEIPALDLPNLPWVLINHNSSQFQAVSFSKDELNELIEKETDPERLTFPEFISMALTNSGSNYEAIATLGGSTLAGEIPCPDECTKYPHETSNVTNIGMPMTIEIDTLHVQQILGHSSCTHLIVKIIDDGMIGFKGGFFPGQLQSNMPFIQYNTAAGYVFREV